MASDAEQIVGLYQRHARAWARDRGGHRLFEKAWLDRFVRLLPVGATVLDVGCGSAEPISRYLFKKGCAVTGVDTSPELIALCREHFSNGNWHIADMRTLSLGCTFNGVLAWDSFFHLCDKDQRSMFPVFRRHAAPRAALMFTSGPAHGTAIGTYQGEPLYHASLDGSEYRALLAANGFEVVGHAVEDPTCGHHTIWLAQLKES